MFKFGGGKLRRLMTALGVDRSWAGISPEA
jgi:hypothetical protein